jgi:hypothetical protein
MNNNKKRGGVQEETVMHTEDPIANWYNKGKGRALQTNRVH